MNLTALVSIVVSIGCTLACSDVGIRLPGHEPYLGQGGGTVWTVSAETAVGSGGDGGASDAGGAPACLSCREALAIEGDGIPVDSSRVCDNAANSRKRWVSYKECACVGVLCPDCWDTCSLTDDSACALCATTQCTGIYDDCMRDDPGGLPVVEHPGVPAPGYGVYYCSVAPPCTTAIGYFYGYPKCGEPGWWGECEQINPTTCAPHFTEAKVLACD